MSIASTVDLLEGKSWVTVLPYHPLFEFKDSPDSQYLLCETRGDLFVWDPEGYCLRTTNLKKLNADTHNEINEGPTEVYQKLNPTITPATHPHSLTPSPTGQHICIAGPQYVYIMELRRSRGPHGEFNSGVEETECRTVSVGDTIIRAHRLEVIQVEWSQEEDGIIAILTNDEMLRFFSISEPNVPRLILNISNKSSSGQHCVTLQEEGGMVGFSLSDGIAFLLQDQLDIQSIPLREGSLISPPVPMYPFNEDNYNGNGRDLLLLPTQPPVLVVASSNGTILHCIFIQESDEVDEAILSVIEIISIADTDDCSVIKLIKDPVARNNYSIQTLTSIYYVHLPWISNLENFSPDGKQYTSLSQDDMAMASIPSLVQWLDNKEGQLAVSLRNVLYALNDNNEVNISPEELTQALMRHRWLIDHQQQDALEFYHVLLTTLEEEMTGSFSVPPQPKSCPLQGLMSSSLVCCDCQHALPTRYESIDSISLPLSQKTASSSFLVECLRDYMSSEIVDDIECPSCSKRAGVKTKRSFRKKLRIGRPPEVLCLNIIRSVWRSDGMMIKNRSRLVFPITLDINSFLTTAATRQDKTKYQLRAVVEHLGGPSSGHYCTYRQCGRQWLYTSDTTVYPVYNHEVMNCEAYLLFYQMD